MNDYLNSEKWEEGYNAFFFRGETMNPYDEDSQFEFFEEWEEGNQRAQADSE